MSIDDLVAAYASRTGWPRCTGLALRSGRTLRSWSTLSSSNPLRPLRALWPRFALRSSNSLVAQENPAIQWRPAVQPDPEHQQLLEAQELPEVQELLAAPQARFGSKKPASRCSHSSTCPPAGGFRCHGSKRGSRHSHQELPRARSSRCPPSPLLRPTRQPTTSSLHPPDADHHVLRLSESRR